MPPWTKIKVTASQIPKFLTAVYNGSNSEQIPQPYTSAPVGTGVGMCPPSKAAGYHQKDIFMSNEH